MNIIGDVAMVDKTHDKKTATCYHDMYNYLQWNLNLCCHQGLWLVLWSCLLLVLRVLALGSSICRGQSSPSYDLVGYRFFNYLTTHSPPLCRSSGLISRNHFRFSWFSSPSLCCCLWLQLLKHAIGPWDVCYPFMLNCKLRFCCISFSKGSVMR